MILILYCRIYGLSLLIRINQKYYIMRKLLIFIISVLFFACSEDKNSMSIQNMPCTNTRSLGKWTIEGGKDTYVLGELLGVRISTGNNMPSNISSASLEMRTADTNNYVAISSGSCASLVFDNVYAFKLGIFYIKGTVFFNDQTSVETEEFKFKVMGPKISDLIERSDVKKRMNDCWNDSKSSEENYSRKEFGFTIQMRIESNHAPEYSFVEGSATSSNDCDTGALNTIRFQTEDKEGNNYASYSVAFFHTHPPLTNCPNTSCRETGPSSTDNTNADDAKIPSVIADYSSSGQICGGHNRNSSYTLSYAGSYTQKQ